MAPKLTTHNGEDLLCNTKERAGSTRIERRGTGIGMRNVHERMQVLYGDAAKVEIESRPGRGTKVSLTMPVLESVGEWGRMRETNFSV